MSFLNQRKNNFPFMPSNCIICEENTSKFCIRGINKNCYCEECAMNQFGDLGLLEKI